jgi:flagellar FliJ protein
MSKSLKSLIRLNEWTVDERRRELAVVMEELDLAELTLKNLEAEVKREQTMAESSPQEAGLFYGSYADGVIMRREDLHQQIRDINVRVDEAREILNEAYRELKKYETAEANRLLKEEKELNRKEQVLLDELGLQNHAKKQLTID